jgi:hypothetical protein
VTARYVIASVAITAIVVLTVWITDLSFERAIILAPVLVIGIAAAAGLVVFWGRVGWDSLRRSRHPWLIVGAATACIAVLIVLTILGVKLPRE